MVQGFLRDLLHLPSHQKKVVGADTFQSGLLVKRTCLASGMLSSFPVVVRAGAWSLVVSSVPPSPFPSFLFLLLPYSLSWEWTGAYLGEGGERKLEICPHCFCDLFWPRPASQRCRVPSVCLVEACNPVCPEEYPGPVVPCSQEHRSSWGLQTGEECWARGWFCMACAHTVHCCCF